MALGRLLGAASVLFPCALIFMLATFVAVDTRQTVDEMTAAVEATLTLEVSCREIAEADAPTQTTASGLQYQILRDCDGPKPTVTSTVTVHYVGTLADGTQFDSSYDRGQPATFGVTQVIAGWTEGLQLMSVGERFRFVMPPELGYGAAGVGRSIPPNATLTFIIELLGFQ